MNYLPKIFTTGAIRETPKKIIDKIADEVSIINERKTIVEIGAGLGEMTEAVIQKLNGGTYDYFAFEIDSESVVHLKEKFSHINIISESAFEFENSIPKELEIDYFISSIPFSFYKKEQIEDLIQRIKKRLSSNGKIIILFTAAWLQPVFKKNLPGMHTEAFLTFPPYFLSVYEHK